MKSIIEALSSSDFEDVKVAITTSKNTLCDKNVVEKVERFEENRKNSTTFQFLMKYKDMVTILFNFINSSQSRNWVAHLNALEEIIPYVSAIDRMKYGRMLPGYLSDIFFLNWDSLHARLYSYYEAWGYKKKNTKRLKYTRNLFRKKSITKRCLIR